MLENVFATVIETNRIRTRLPWAQEMGVSSHRIPHTTLPRVDLATSVRVVQAFDVKYDK